MTLSNLSSSSLYRVGTGLVGVGNWAQVTATTGSPTTGTYTDANGVAWKYYQWTASGSFTATAGLIDVLVVGGGGAGGGGAGQGGDGGHAIYGPQSFTAAMHTVTVGGGGSQSPEGTQNGGVGSPNPGQDSVCGPYTAGGGERGAVSNTSYGGSGAVRRTTGVIGGLGVTSSITGSAIGYGGGGGAGTNGGALSAGSDGGGTGSNWNGGGGSRGTTNRGGGGGGGGRDAGGAATGWSGGSGIVIIRVPSTFALA